MAGSRSRLTALQQDLEATEIEFLRIHSKPVAGRAALNPLGTEHRP